MKRFTRFIVTGRRGRWRGLILLIIALALFTAAYFMPGQPHPRQRGYDGAASEEPRSSAIPDSLTSVAVPVAFVVVILGIYYWRATRASAYEAYSPGIFKPLTYEVLEGGFFCQNERGETLSYWPAVTRFVETEEDFYVMLAPRKGHTLPKRCFPTQEAMAIFRNQMHMYLEKHAPAALAAR